MWRFKPLLEPHNHCWGCDAIGDIPTTSPHSGESNCFYRQILRGYYCRATSKADIFKTNYVWNSHCRGGNKIRDIYIIGFHSKGFPNEQFTKRPLLKFLLELSLDTPSKVS